jgi:hypothetical protein
MMMTMTPTTNNAMMAALLEGGVEAIVKEKGARGIRALPSSREGEFLFSRDASTTAPIVGMAVRFVRGVSSGAQSAFSTGCFMFSDNFDGDADFVPVENPTFGPAKLFLERYHARAFIADGAQWPTARVLASLPKFAKMVDCTTMEKAVEAPSTAPCMMRPTWRSRACSSSTARMALLKHVPSANPRFSKLALGRLVWFPLIAEAWEGLSMWAVFFARRLQLARQPERLTLPFLIMILNRDGSEGGALHCEVSAKDNLWAVETPVPKGAESPLDMLLPAHGDDAAAEPSGSVPARRGGVYASQAWRGCARCA